MNYRPRVHCLIPNPSDATSLYRASGPLSKLKHYIDCEFNFNTNVSWDTLSWCDIIFMQRPWGKAFHKACQIAVNNNVPIWIDYDDYLLDVPHYNPHRKAFANHHDQKQMIEMIEMATVITVTTDKLKEKFSQHNENVFVVPNALDDYTFEFSHSPSKNKIVNWRGSNTHSEDLKTIVPNIRALQETKVHLDWMFNFIGKDAESLKGQGVYYKHQSPIDPIEYFHYIYDLRPAIQIVPLVDNEFNKAKSNIGWLEGIYSGAICIAPKSMPEFNRPGCLLYEDADDFEKILKACMTDINLLEGFYTAGYEFVKENLLLSVVNKLRKQVIEQLLDMRKK